MKLQPEAARSHSRRRLLGVVVVSLLALGALSLVGSYVQQRGKLSALERQFAEELARNQQEHQTAMEQEEKNRGAQAAAEEAAHRALMLDPKAISGALAQERHQAEWARRLAHDPQFARTAIETNFLQMEQLGRDPGVAAAVALEKVAKLAAPPRSRIAVSPLGDGFVVRVAFRMSTLSANEAGAVTKHHTTASMRREIEQLSARVMKDLFDYCGSRGIESLSVSCNHAMRRTVIPTNATAREREELLQRAPVEMGNLYRVRFDRRSARAIANWRQVSVPRVIALMTVESDGLKNLEISGAASPFSNQSDPEGMLEF